MISFFDYAKNIVEKEENAGYHNVFKSSLKVIESWDCLVKS